MKNLSLCFVCINFKCSARTREIVIECNKFKRNNLFTDNELQIKLEV